MTIADCVIATPGIIGAARFDGVVAESNGSWVVTDLRAHTPERCVPAALAEPALETYDEYWDARQRIWDPPNPENPELAQFVTGKQLDVERNALNQYVNRDAVLKGRPQTHPEILEVRSATELVVRDCQVWSPDYGIFDRTTGQRLEGIDLLDPNQPRYAVSAVMDLGADGNWRISDRQGSKLTLDPGKEVACEFAPSAQGLPQV